MNGKGMQSDMAITAKRGEIAKLEAKIENVAFIAELSQAEADTCHDTLIDLEAKADMLRKELSVMLGEQDD